MGGKIEGYKGNDIHWWNTNTGETGTGLSVEVKGGQTFFVAEAFRGDKWPKKGFFPNAYTVLDPGPENGLVIEFNSSKHVKVGTGETKIVNNVFKASGE